MGILSTAVAQMIASMEPDERRQTILDVTGQALQLMDGAERLVLTRHLFEALILGLPAAERTRLVAELATTLSRRVPE